MFPYDATLLNAIQAAPRSISDVLQTLQTIGATCADTDGLKWFNWLYLEVTQAVEARVAAGGFTDSAWLAQLDVQFARLYFSALKSSLSGEATPTCWRVLFDSRNHGAIARIQFALAGINAHINHDLPEAIVATCQVTDTTPDSGGSHFSDYTSLNSTLDGLIESAKVTLNVRLPGGAPADLPSRRYNCRLERQRGPGGGVAKRWTSLAAMHDSSAYGELHGHVGRVDHCDQQGAFGAGTTE